MGAIASVRNAGSRLASGAGVAILLTVTVLNLLGRAVQQRVEEPELPADFQRENPELADQFQSIAEQYVGFQNALSLELSGTLATTLGLLLSLLGFLLFLFALDAFGREEPTIDGSLLDGSLWNGLNLFVGFVGVAVLFVIGFIVTFIPAIIPFVGFLISLLLLVVIPVAIATALLYFPAAIAIDGKNVIEAYSDSFQLAKAAPLSAIGVAVLLFVLGVGNAVLTVALIFGAPPLAGAVTSTVVGSITWTISIAVLAQAYVVTSDRVDEHVRDDSGSGQSSLSGPEQRTDDEPPSGSESGTADEPASGDQPWADDDATIGDDTPTDDDGSGSDDAWTDDDGSGSDDAWTNDGGSGSDDARTDDSNDEDGETWTDDGDDEPWRGS